MLTVYLRGVSETNADVIPEGLDIVTDSESAFTLLDFQATEPNKSLVREIDKGELLDRRFFLDRFGVQLYTEMLSTGCKTALLVNNTNKVIDLLECGANARDAIFANCKNGSIVMDIPDIALCTLGKGPVEVCINGHMFHSLDDVNWYLEDGILEETGDD
jgi:hypothetical protein